MASDANITVGNQTGFLRLCPSLFTCKSQVTVVTIVGHGTDGGRAIAERVSGCPLSLLQDTTEIGDAESSEDAAASVVLARSFGVCCYFDAATAVIYLVTTAPQDAHNLTSRWPHGPGAADDAACDILEDLQNSQKDIPLDEQTSDLLWLWLERAEVQHIKTLLVLFQVSHFVIMELPSPRVDINVVRTLRLLQSLKSAMQSNILALVSTALDGMYGDRGNRDKGRKKGQGDTKRGSGGKGPGGGKGAGGGKGGKGGKGKDKGETEDGPSQDAVTAIGDSSGIDSGSVGCIANGVFSPVHCVPMIGFVCPPPAGMTLHDLQLQRLESSLDAQLRQHLLTKGKGVETKAPRLFHLLDIGAVHVVHAPIAVAADSLSQALAFAATGSCATGSERDVAGDSLREWVCTSLAQYVADASAVARRHNKSFDFPVGEMWAKVTNVLHLALCSQHFADGTVKNSKTLPFKRTARGGGAKSTSTSSACLKRFDGAMIGAHASLTTVLGGVISESGDRLLPICVSAYLGNNDNEPVAYTKTTHNARVSRAIEMLKELYRGPNMASLALRLKAVCYKEWNCDRRLCDAVSLTGHACRHVVEATSHGDGSHQVVGGDMEVEWGHGEKRHSSGEKITVTCACGHKRKELCDPFNMNDGNQWAFMAASCCDFMVADESRNTQNTNARWFNVCLLSKLQSKTNFDKGRLLSKPATGVGAPQLLRSALLKGHATLFPISLPTSIGGAVSDGVEVGNPAICCTIHMGLEYECMRGHGCILPPKPLKDTSTTSVGQEQTGAKPGQPPLSDRARLLHTTSNPTALLASRDNGSGGIGVSCCGWQPLLPRGLKVISKCACSQDGARLRRVWVSTGDSRRRFNACPSIVCETEPDRRMGWSRDADGNGGVDLSIGALVAISLPAFTPLVTTDRNGDDAQIVGQWTVEPSSLSVHSSSVLP